ncbi:C6 zinc finger domain-containing protein [Colletotrichum musicola]|uniref:C6 zinc finger domain-containing protein n=1 Tax=Colletotrichum musicola TaxID=2175873 RepID=A0A8H6K3H9_9PEZI|nr:C6 zinc finger domain-containing protein [Colletotrichum musicola]
MLPAPPSKTRGSFRVRFAPKQEIKDYAPPVVPHARPPLPPSLPLSKAEGHATSLQDGPVQSHGQGHAKDRQQQLLLHDQKQPSLPVRRHTKSRLGCKECKLRKVKCDQTLPVCIRCQRRGSVCYSERPPGNWQVVMPLMISRSLEDPWMGEVKPDRNLLQFWLEQTSHMMALRADDNPLSYPLLEHLVSTPSLLHAVQSISAGQERFFDKASLPCLKQRGLTLQALRREMRNASEITPATLVAIFLQGVSWTWTEGHTKDYGREHLCAARSLLNSMLQDPHKRQQPMVQYLLGWYLYWDMSCAFVAKRGDLPPLDTPLILEHVRSMRGSFHAMVGFSAELMYLIGCLGRHCRVVIDTGRRDPILEASFEARLRRWNPENEDRDLVDLSMAYRNYGLIMLYNICGVPAEGHGQNTMGGEDKTESISTDEQRGEEPADEGAEALHQKESPVRLLAIDILDRLFRCSIDTPAFNFHATPLLTASAELRGDEMELRERAVNHFKAMYSTNRVVVNMWAIDLLREVWDYNDAGTRTTWLELLRLKDWTFTFA